MVELRINPEYRTIVHRPTPEEYNSIKESIRTKGQRYPIIVNKEFEVLDGHTRSIYVRN